MFEVGIWGCIFTLGKVKFSFTTCVLDMLVLDYLAHVSESYYLYFQRYNGRRFKETAINCV